ncbi:MAG TPA: hypothetical protein VFC56_19255 [Stellaceae bacterium]|nr:hypothetical protein [Stellaceae bacterium]
METHQKRPGERRRTPLSVRIKKETREALLALSTAEDRSLTTTAEMLIEQALDRRHLLDQVFDLTYQNPKLIGLLLMIGHAANNTLSAIEAKRAVTRQQDQSAPEIPWINDPDAFNEVAVAAKQVIEAFRPVGDRGGGALGKAIGRDTIFHFVDGPPGNSPALDAARNRIDSDAVARARRRQRFYDDDGMIGPTTEELELPSKGTQK